MDINRRDFLNVAALSTAALITGKATASSHIEPVAEGQQFGVLVDTVVCISCRKCEWACNQQNSLTTKDRSTFEDKSVFAQNRRPDKTAYTVVNEYRGPQATDKNYGIKIQCMHCSHPACVSACIVGALRKDPRGPVFYDAWKCIGCRYCMVACPFQIPAYEYDNAFTPKVQKCSFCYERTTKQGLPPACVEICPNEALTFGPRDEMIDLAYSRIKAYPEKYYDHVYGENEIGGTSWMYLASTDFVNTELPKLSEKPIPELTETIQHGVFKSFVPPLALYGLLAVAMHSFKDDKKDEEAHK